MRNWIAAAAVFAGFAAPGAFAQSPDCRVVLFGANTAQHAAEIVVAPGAAVTLETHCRGSGQATYRWNSGATTFDIRVTAPAAGNQDAFTVEVTQNGATRSFTGTVRAAAAGTPVCTIAREPIGDIRVFTTVRLTAVCTGSPASHTWTGGYDLRGQGNAAVIHVNIVNEAATIPIDVIAANATGPGAAAGTSVRYTVAPPACRIVASPAGRVAPNTAVTLTAQCDGAPTSYSWAHGVVGSTVVVNPAVTATYTLRAANAVGTGFPAVHTIPVATTGPGLRDYTGHWWGGTTENGWGMTLNQHGQAIFGVIYFYDATGEPTWAVMPGGTWNADFTVFTADMYSPRGTPFSDYDASQLVAGAPTGSITITFASPTQLTASYRLGYSQFDPSGPSITTFGQKSMTPLILNEGTSPTGLSLGDMWWGGASQNGWGISISQRNSELFAPWFTYGADRRPTWFIVTGASWSGSTLLASVFRVTGSPWLGTPYDATLVTSTNMGPANLNFIDRASGTFAYSVGPAAALKVIQRQEF
jgi:hypothetical protein